MAAEQEWVCPICREVRKDIAYAVPCHHEFCLGCILRWGKQQKSCPLCRRDMEVVKVAEWDDDEDLDFIIWPPAPPVPACFQEGLAPSHSSSSSLLSPLLSPSPFSDEEENAEADMEEGEEADGEEAEEEEEEEETEDQDDEEAEEGPVVGGLQPQAWAELFRQHQEILDPVLPLLRQELRAIFDTHWWPAVAAENYILDALCDIGLHSEELMELMRPALGVETETFIQGLVDTIVRQCGEEAHRLLGLQGAHVSAGQEEGPAARGQEDSPVAAPGPTASPQVTLTRGPGLSGSIASPNREERPSTAGARVCAQPSPNSAVHVAREAEEPDEEMELAAAAGPSAQGSSPSAPGHSPERARRPPKRSADSDQDAQPPCKRPPPRRD
ncbi:E3 ubiquitin-protein ligase Topors-like [Numida meleagris]|uniref:E3 ubiquitin-protein ligase Topors-like n=1 Tax=Numida meleagris TaxID=8996 RepID=UPI000B3E1A2E|nr:E3 ubiquitin-protein ligase Topors-like [Numida meleagris]